MTTPLPDKDHTMTLSNYYVTFGVMYRHEKHPHWPDAHPDGWLEVIAPDYGTAWDLTQRYVGNKFAFMYEADRFERKWHPLGRLATLTEDGVLWPAEGVAPPTPLTEQEVPAPTVVAEHTLGTAAGDTLKVGFIEVNHDHTPVAYAELGQTTVSIFRNENGKVCIEIDDVADEPVDVTVNAQRITVTEEP